MATAYAVPATSQTAPTLQCSDREGLSSTSHQTTCPASSTASTTRAWIVHMRTERRETRCAGSRSTGPRSTGPRSTGRSAGSTAPRCHTIPTDAARHTVGAVSALVMVEGLPGSGKSTTSHAIAAWLADHQVAAEHWAEGRTDHPVDFEQVAVLSRGDL